MRKEMIIRMQMNSEKSHSKAMRVAAAVDGVESVTIAGEDKNLLLVIGDGVDSNYLTNKLRRKVGHAEIVELRTVDTDAWTTAPGNEIAEHAYRYHPTPSPYHQMVARDYYTTSNYNPHVVAPVPDQHRSNYYAPNMMQQQHEYHYPGNDSHTVVHHEYPSDPNNCSIM